MTPTPYDQRLPQICFTTSTRMARDIHEACKTTGTQSQTVYIQRAVCDALARDLHLPLDTLLADLPEPKRRAATLFGGKRARITDPGQPE